MRANGRPVRLYDYGGEGQPDQPWTGPYCGTYKGYLEHYRNRDPQCEACRQARNQYVKEWRLATGRVKTIRVRPTEAQLALLRAGNKTLCQAEGTKTDNGT